MNGSKEAQGLKNYEVIYAIIVTVNNEFKIIDLKNLKNKEALYRTPPKQEQITDVQIGARGLNVVIIITEKKPTGYETRELIYSTW